MKIIYCLGIFFVCNVFLIAEELNNVVSQDERDSEYSIIHQCDKARIYYLKGLKGHKDCSSAEKYIARIVTGMALAVPVGYFGYTRWLKLSEGQVADQGLSMVINHEINSFFQKNKKKLSQDDLNISFVIDESQKKITFDFKISDKYQSWKINKFGRREVLYASFDGTSDNSMALLYKSLIENLREKIEQDFEIIENVSFYNDVNNNPMWKLKNTDPVGFVKKIIEYNNVTSNLLMVRGKRESDSYKLTLSYIKTVSGAEEDIEFRIFQFIGTTYQNDAYVNLESRMTVK